MNKIKRLYNEDGSLTQTSDAPQDGWHYYHKMKEFVKQLAKEAQENNIDLRDLQCVLHSAIDLPVIGALLNRRIKETELEEVNVNR